MVPKRGNRDMSFEVMYTFYVNSDEFHLACNKIINLLHDDKLVTYGKLSPIEHFLDELNNGETAKFALIKTVKLFTADQDVFNEIMEESGYGKDKG